MNIYKISIARQPPKTFEKFMVISKSRNTTPIWPIRTQKCHFSWPEKLVWCHHDISVRCFKHVRHLVRKTKWPNLASSKSGVTAETTARFNRKFLKNTTLSRFRIYTMKKFGIPPISMWNCSDIHSGDIFCSAIYEGTLSLMSELTANMAESVNKNIANTWHLT